MATLRGLAPQLTLLVMALAVLLAALVLPATRRRWLPLAAIFLLAPVAAAILAATAGNGEPLLLLTAPDSLAAGEPISGGGVAALLSLDGWSTFVMVLGLAITAACIGLRAVPLVALPANDAASADRPVPGRPGIRSAVQLVALAGAFTAASATHLTVLIGAVQVTAIAMLVATWMDAPPGGGVLQRIGSIVATVLGAGLLVAGCTMIAGEAHSTYYEEFATPAGIGSLTGGARTNAVTLLLLGLALQLVVAPAVRLVNRRTSDDPGTHPATMLWPGLLGLLAGVSVVGRLLIVSFETPLGFGAALDGVDFPLIFASAAILLIVSGHAVALFARDLRVVVGGWMAGWAGTVFAALAAAAALAPALLAPAESLDRTMATRRIAEALGAAGLTVWAMVVMFVGVGAVLVWLRRLTERSDLDAANGLLLRVPGLAIGLTILLFGLVGVPPTVGFMSRFQSLMPAFMSGREQLIVSIELLNLMAVLVGFSILGIALGLIVATRIGRRLVKRPDSPDEASTATTTATVGGPAGFAVVLRLMVVASVLATLVLGMLDIWTLAWRDAFLTLRAF